MPFGSTPTRVGRPGSFARARFGPTVDGLVGTSSVPIGLLVVYLRLARDAECAKTVS